MYCYIMYDITTIHRAAAEARRQAGLTQSELAARAGTSQPAVAKLEQGETNPTLSTLARCAEAAGFELRFEFVPRTGADPVIEAYKRDVDRSLLRENLRASVDSRLRTLGEWQATGRELQRAARAARQRNRRDK